MDGPATPRSEPRSSRSAWIWWTVLALVVVASIPMILWYEEPEPLPVLRTVPEFSFRDQRGETVSSADLGGKVWVADFFFTRCSQACPLMTSQMGNVQAVIAGRPELAESVRIVSFSLDPDHDTPEILDAYARLNGVDAEIWSLLTGPFEEVRALCEQGFGLSTGKTAARAMHSDRFAVVDRAGRVRGYYRPTAERGDLARLLADLERLVAEPEEGKEARP